VSQVDDMNEWRSDDPDRWWEGNDPPAPLPFERRRHDRRLMQGAARAVLLDSEHFGQMRQLALLDYSAGGIGAISSAPITPGTSVSIGFTSHGYPAERGTVVKCMPCGAGYRVAIRFDLRMAA
jgi:hypothetical protein